MEGEGGVVAVVDALLVDVADVQLHRAVVLGRDQLVGPRAALTARGPRQRLSQNGY